MLHRDCSAMPLTDDHVVRHSRFWRRIAAMGLGCVRTLWRVLLRLGTRRMRYARQRLHQEVRRAHARLDRAEGVLDRLAPLAHGLRILVEPPLHGLEHMRTARREGASLFKDRCVRVSL